MKFPYASNDNFNKFKVFGKSKFVLIVTAVCFKLVDKENKSWSSIPKLVSKTISERKLLNLSVELLFIHFESSLTLLQALTLKC
ncbi:MAG: hypothetical protein ACTS6A_00020 [Candidatus Hodgkinia cicadicola]